MTKVFWFFFAFIGPSTVIQFGYDPLTNYIDIPKVKDHWYLIRFNGYIHNNHILLIICTLFLLIGQVYRNHLKLPKIFFLIILFYSYVLFCSYINNSYSIDKYAQYLFFFLPIIFVFVFFKTHNDIKYFILVIYLYLLFNALVGLYDTFQWIYWNGFNYGWSEFCYFNSNCPFIHDTNFTFRVRGLGLSQIGYVSLLFIGLIVAEIANNKIINNSKYFFLFMLLISFSRTAYVVSAIYLLTYSPIIINFFIKNTPILFRLKNIIIIFILLIFLFPLTGIIFDRITDIGNLNFNIARISIYDFGIKEVFKSEESILFGYGLGNFEFIYSDSQIFKNTHNIYIDVLHGSGVVGLLIFLLIILLLVLNNLKNIFSITSSLETIAINKKILVLHVMVWASCFVENTILSVEVGWILGFLFSIPLFINYDKKTKNINYY